jgi:hypothetical protein
MQTSTSVYVLLVVATLCAAYATYLGIREPGLSFVLPALFAAILFPAAIMVARSAPARRGGGGSAASPGITAWLKGRSQGTSRR